MSFLYINPGDASLLDTTTGVTVEDARFNPYGGVSFWQPKSEKGIVLPYPLTEIYAKASVYLRGSLTKSDARAKLQAGNSNGWTVRENYGKWSLEIACCATQIKSLSGEEINLDPNGFNNILLHVKEGSSEEGSISVTINGKEVFASKQYVTFRQSSYGSPSDVITILSDNEEALFSNIIISDKEIGEKEQVAVLPVSATDTDMTANGDGSYTATEEGQHFFQSFDAASLIDAYGGASNVTGIYIAGKPAYATGSELTKAVACGGKDGAMADISTTTLKMDSTATALIGGRVSMTLGDLQGYKFGWKAGV